MRVAVLFSGGKDSCQAVRYCQKQGWDITLVAVRPKNPEAYLWHYATVDLAPLVAEALGLPIIMLKCDVIGPEAEARVLEKVLDELEPDALVFGGNGTQETQIRTVRTLAKKRGIEVIVPYEGWDSEKLFKEEIKAGFDIRMTDVSADGLGPEWLGKKLNKQNFRKLLALSKRFGFDLLGEGGQFNTFVVDGPGFKKRIHFQSKRKIWDTKTGSGYLEVDAELVEK